MRTKSLSAFIAIIAMSATQSFAQQTVPESHPEFDSFVVGFDAGYGYPAEANLYVPRSQQTRKLPALVLQFGAQGDKDADYIVEIGHGIARRGFIVITVDMPGRGQRAYSSPAPDNYEQLIRWYMKDYEHTVNYLQTLPQVDRSRIHFAGTSLGAITGIPFCAKDLRIRSCISIVGGGSLRSGLPPELDCVQTVGKIAPRPTMLINGVYDFIIPFTRAKNLHNNARYPVEKIWYPADHFLRGIDKEQLYDRMAAFLKNSGQ